MPFYKFLIHGRDVEQPEEIRGFWVVRSAFGSTENAAGAKVMVTIERELMAGKSASSWHSKPPEMVVKEADRIGLLELRQRNSGFIFYWNDRPE